MTEDRIREAARELCLLLTPGVHKESPSIRTTCVYCYRYYMLIRREVEHARRGRDAEWHDELAALSNETGAVFAGGSPAELIRCVWDDARRKAARELLTRKPTAMDWPTWATRKRREFGLED